MSGLKIVLPKTDGVRYGVGTRYYYDGTEIDNVLRARIDLEPSCIITATLEIVVGEIENMDQMVAILENAPIESVAALAEKHDFELVKK